MPCPSKGAILDLNFALVEMFVLFQMRFKVGESELIHLEWTVHLWLRIYCLVFFLWTVQTGPFRHSGASEVKTYYVQYE